VDPADSEIGRWQGSPFMTSGPSGASPDLARSGTNPTHADSFAALSQRYSLIICDVWGVLHNGVSAFAPAHQALAQARAAGKTVILLSNAPRPNPSIMAQLDRLGVPREAYDAVVTSGDMTRERIIADPRSFYMIGPERDLPLIEGLDRRTTLDEAAYVLCTGLFDDDTETPKDYDPTLARMNERGLAMICANPDLVVERGETLVYCAGAIGERYLSQGGEVALIGKPHAVAYEAALARAAEIGKAPFQRSKILAIGDAIRTDVAGARNFGIDSLFLTGGIHAAETMTSGEIDSDKLTRFLASQTVRTEYVAAALRW